MPRWERPFPIVRANINHGISLFVDQGTLVHPKTTRAIGLMFHLEKEIGINGRDTVTDPYVTYGPVPDALNATDAAYEDHSWLVEVYFYILNEPTKRWTAVLHVRAGREPVDRFPAYLLQCPSAGLNVLGHKQDLGFQKQRAGPHSEFLHV